MLWQGTFHTFKLICMCVCSTSLCISTCIWMYECIFAIKSFPYIAIPLILHLLIFIEFLFLTSLLFYYTNEVQSVPLKRRNVVTCIRTHTQTNKHNFGVPNKDTRNTCRCFFEFSMISVFARVLGHVCVLTLTTHKVHSEAFN